MSVSSSMRVAFVIIILSFGLPFVFLFFLFEYLGIAEYVFPTLLPIIGFTFLLLIVIFGLVFGAIRWSTGKIGTVYSQQYSTYTTPKQKRYYLVPVQCPHCDREIELGRAEWRDNRTMICSRCFTDIQIQRS
ncbi:MAG: hypothetical protein GF411_17690 [Candidatus Lokiarchaeota archaeon]|nr:hypothetical protein [Candidatus Lokiarchaeota archaeon]